MFTSLSYPFYTNPSVVGYYEKYIDPHSMWVPIVILLLLAMGSVLGVSSVKNISKQIQSKSIIFIAGCIYTFPIMVLLALLERQKNDVFMFYIALGYLWPLFFSKKVLHDLNKYLPWVVFLLLPLTIIFYFILIHETSHYVFLEIIYMILWWLASAVAYITSKSKPDTKKLPLNPNHDQYD